VSLTENHLSWKLIFNFLFSPGATPHLGPLLGIGGRTTSICNERLTLEQKKRGILVFKDFVERTVSALVELENGRRGDLSSSLQVFCRVDVGVLFKGGSCYYYVNEVERSLTTGLYQQMGPIVLTMLDSAVANIPLYLSRSRRPS
jgi:hypothetical protein